jgi:hypothetical protein
MVLTPTDGEEVEMSYWYSHDRFPDYEMYLTNNMSHVMYYYHAPTSDNGPGDGGLRDLRLRAKERNYKVGCNRWNLLHKGATWIVAGRDESAVRPRHKSEP